MRLHRLLLVGLGLMFLAGCARGVAQAEAGEPAPLPAAMKGYELYSWQTGARGRGTWHFKLITGTNRLKSQDEVLSDEEVAEGWVNIRVKGVPALKALLDRVPEGTTVVWIGPEARAIEGWDGRQGRLGLPDAVTVRELVDHCEARGVSLAVAAGDE